MRELFKFLYIVLFILCLCFEVIGQVTISEFLRSAKDDRALKLFDDQVHYLQQKPYQLSPLQKLELRTGSNQLDPDRQDYAIRINPANPWEVRNNNNYFKEYQLILTTKKGIVLKEVLAARYQIVNDFMYCQQQLALIEKDRKLTEAAVIILGKQQYFNSFNGDDYVKYNLDQMNKTVAFEEASFQLDNQLALIVEKYPNALDKTVKWDYQQMITIDQIENIVDSLLRVEGSIATIAYQEGKVNLANQEYKLEKSNINVGYLQTQYQPYRIEQGRKPWNISLGVTIPITNPNKGDMTKKKLEAIEAQHDLENIKSDLRLQSSMFNSKLHNLIKRYRIIHAKLEELNASNLAKTLIEMNNNNPLAVIQFNGNILKLEEIVLRLKHTITSSYIEFLASIDKLQERPIKNYIATDFEAIGF